MEDLLISMAFCLVLATSGFGTMFILFDENVQPEVFYRAIEVCGDRGLERLELDVGNVDVYCKDGSVYPDTLVRYDGGLGES